MKDDDSCSKIKRARNREKGGHGLVLACTLGLGVCPTPTGVPTSSIGTADACTALPVAVGALNFVTISFPFYIYYYFTKRSHKEEEEEHSIWQARNEAISKSKGD